MNGIIRPMSFDDIDAVIAIESEYYVGDLVEPARVIGARLRDFPDTAWVVEDAQGVCAYLAAYPSRLGKVTPLGSEFPRYEQPETLYLHDMAVLRRAAGRGYGSRLARWALDFGRREGLPYSSLVALPDAAAFWERLGYRKTALTETQQQDRLKNYTSGACYMVLPLSNWHE